MRKILCVVLFGCMFVGCLTSPTDDVRVTVDPALNNSIRVPPLVMARTADHFLIVQANIANTQKDNTPLEYTVQFLDQNGLVIKSVLDGWTSVLLAPKETRSVSVAAPTTAATDCRFLIRKSAW